MKKWLCLFLIALEIGCVIPQISIAKSTDEFGYSSIIGEYRQAVINAKYHDEDWPGNAYTFDWEPLAYVIVYTYLGLIGSVQDYFGYAFRDLNSDRQPELFLLIKQYQYDYGIEEWVNTGNPNYAILAICTLTDGTTPEWCWVGGYGNDGIGDDICYLNADDTLTVVMADAIAEGVMTYRLGSSGNDLIALDEIGWDSAESFELGFYKRSGNEEKIAISEDEYRDSPLWPENYSEKHGDLVFIPLFGE